jgi:hypothetical protein
VHKVWFTRSETCTYISFGRFSGKLNKPDCPGGARDSRTDCLLVIDACGCTRSCGHHGYLAATHNPPRWRNTRVHSNPDRNRLADPVLGSDRTRLGFEPMDSRYLDSCPTLHRALDPVGITAISRLPDCRLSIEKRMSCSSKTVAGWSRRKLSILCSWHNISGPGVLQAPQACYHGPTHEPSLSYDSR